MAVCGVAYASQSNRLLRNVTIGGVNVGNLTSAQALAEVEEAWSKFSDQAFQFSIEDKDFSVSVTADSADKDQVILDLATFDSIHSINNAFAFGHEGPWWQRLRVRLSAWLGRQHEFGTFSLSTTSLQEVLAKQLTDYDQAPVDAGLDITSGTEMAVTDSQPGQTVDKKTAITRAKSQLRLFNPAPIELNIDQIQPTVAMSPGLEELAASQVPGILEQPPLELTDGEEKWAINEKTLRGLLGFVRRGTTVGVGFDRQKVTAFLEDLRPDIDVAARDAKFSVVNGKVEEFQTSVVGRSLDSEATIQAMDAAMIVKKERSVAVVVTETKPLTDTVAPNELGITELVGEAKTNFRGSPPNRIYNLTFGSKRLHGLLIQPGETFSLVAALGKIDGKNGWKPELVIKGTKITPEFGGGLCQVATTLFRTVLNVGLPVTERHNHSLRISYYEPPIGLDATIYEPRPDLKFVNDYPHALLLQTRIEGTELIYSFYGTQDGRKVNLPEPKVYNKTGIPATKNIEVDDLKPGEKECQAPGHPGADATATYTVTKADGTAVTQVFQSHYRPIGVICRVGKKVEP